MPVIVRESRRPDETDKEFAERDEAHWRKVVEAEALVLRLRERRIPPVDRGQK